MTLAEPSGPKITLPLQPLQTAQPSGQASRLWGQRWHWLLVCLACCICGCGTASDMANSPNAGSPGTSETAAPGASQPAPTRLTTDGLLQDRTVYDIALRNDEREGYTKLAVSTQPPAQPGGTALQRVELFTQFKVLRGQDVSTLESNVICLEQASGDLVEIESRISLGPSPTRFVGKVTDGKLHGEITDGEDSRPFELAGMQGVQGPGAEYRELWRRPLLPGESRTIKTFDPTIMGVAIIEFTAHDYEQVDFHKERLLKITSVTQLKVGNEPHSTTAECWADAAGDIWATQTDFLGLKFVRGTEHDATLPYEPTQDLLTETSISLRPGLDQPHGTKRVKYLVRHADADPATMFGKGLTQSVEPLGERRCMITVLAVRPDALPAEAAVETSAEEDLAPSALIPCDHPKLMALAESGVQKAASVWDKAMALETLVHERITKRNFTAAFANALDVAEHGEGDCTEHAVLFAALARAQKIPTRLVTGLVSYSDGRNMAFHMWNECLIDGHWIPLDATLGQGGIGAGHIKITASSLADNVASEALLSTMDLLGKLSIQVEEQE